MAMWTGMPMDVLAGTCGYDLDTALVNEAGKDGEGDGLRYLDGPMFCCAILAKQSGACIQKEIRRSNLE